VRLGVDGTVRFCGWVDEPGPWVAGAAIQACPSRDESFSQAAALAMGLGVPVVGTEVDGFPDTLGEGRGILVPPEAPGALAGALEGVLTRRLRPDLEAARHWARQFDVHAVAAAYERAYAELRDRALAS
jgi:glycosyltransferase involved in cell wall biosynthesis